MSPRPGACNAGSTAFLNVLRSVGADGALGDDRFSVRNLMLDEIVSSERMTSYRKVVERASLDFPSWHSAHATYVAGRLRLTGFSLGLPHALRQRNPDECPETFRVTPALARFGGTDDDVDLVRVVSLWAIADANDIAEDEAREALMDRPRRERLVRVWASALPIEPVFATFWWHVRDLLPSDAAAVPLGWADTLRDRLGLSHYDPRARGTPIEIVVLCYPVSAVRKVVGLRGRQPLAVPTSIDSAPFPPFCPAPEGSKFGQIVDLNGQGDRPAPEVIHPTAQWTGDHVYRLGTITRGAGDLAYARGIHLLRVRDDAGRPDYAHNTDADLV